MPFKLRRMQDKSDGRGLCGENMCDGVCDRADPPAGLSLFRRPPVSAVLPQAHPFTINTAIFWLIHQGGFIRQ